MSPSTAQSLVRSSGSSMASAVSAMAFGRTSISRGAATIFASRTITRGRIRSNYGDYNSVWIPLTTQSRDQVGLRFVSTSCARSRTTATPIRSPEPSPSSTLCPDPLNPTIPLSSLGLPLHPLPLPTSILHPPTVPISSTSLHTLHRLSAISPPASQAEEERLKDGLGKLIGLMEGVKDVKLEYEALEPAEAKRMIREDLVKGFWADPEDVFDGSDIEEGMVETADEMPRGRELLKWGRRVRDGQYVFDASRK